MGLVLRSRCLAATLILVVPSAALAALLTLPAAASVPAAVQGHVVIAVLDTGISPYHAEFADAAFLDHPATYLQGYPASAQPLALCLDAAAPACSDVQGARAADAARWAALPATRPGPDGWGPLHYVPGTRIVGLASFGDGGFVGPTRGFDDDGHGTAVASLAAGRTLGLCPRCLIVSLEGPGTEALQWALAQPWIDVVTNSWGLVANLDWPPPPIGAAYLHDARLTRDMVEQGKPVLFAAGNGLGTSLVPGVTEAPDYLLPGESTYTSQYTGPDWVLTIGATDPANGQPVAGAARPVDVSAAGLEVKAADARFRSGALLHFGGTSAATPIVAGALGHVLLAAREALGDPRTGPHADGALARGSPPAGTLPTSPLADGALTRAELERLVLSTAQVCPAHRAWTHDLALDAREPGCPLEVWPFPFGVWGWAAPTPPLGYPLLVGYGTVDARTRDLAVQALVAGAPPRCEADAWARLDAAVRLRMWGAWEGQGQTGAPLPCRAATT